MELEDRIKALEAKVHELSDKDEIRDLRSRYHECINENIRAGIPELFTEDGVLEFGPLGNAKGRDKIAEFFGVVMPAAGERTPTRHIPPFTKVKQYPHNHVIKVNGDTGTGFAYLEAKPLVGGRAYRVAARYNDEYLRVNGRWYFKAMRLALYYALPFDDDWATQELVQLKG